MWGVRELIEDGEAFDFVRLAKNFAIPRQRLWIARDVHDAIESRTERAHLVAHARARWVDQDGVQIVRGEIDVFESRVLSTAVEGVAEFLRRETRGDDVIDAVRGHVNVRRRDGCFRYLRRETLSK